MNTKCIIEKNLPAEELVRHAREAGYFAILENGIAKVELTKSRVVWVNTLGNLKACAKNLKADGSNWA